MKCTCNANDSIWVIFEHYLFPFTNIYWLAGHKSNLSAPNANLFRLSAPKPPKDAKCNVYRHLLLVLGQITQIDLRIL